MKSQAYAWRRNSESIGEDTTKIMKKTSKEPIESGNELKEAIELLEKEKNIS